MTALDPDTVDAYLRRIAVPRSEVTLDLDGLARLQHAHMLAVPFTNLDVFDGKAVHTGLDWSIPAVLEGRGGWCFVLNGAFSALLESLGFEVVRMGALVVKTPNVSPMDDHLTLRVELEEPWLVDVGFGESCTRPLPLSRGEAPVEDVASGRRYRIVTGDDDRLHLQSEQGQGTDAHWQTDFLVDPSARQLHDFSAANDYLAATPGLPWTAKPFSTRLTDDGRVTLLSDRIKFSLLWSDDLEEPLGDTTVWEAARQRHLPTPG